MSQIAILTPEQIQNIVTQTIRSALENMTVPTPISPVPAPAKFEVSLSFLAAATGASKSTIERRIAENKLPKPQVNPDNRYRYWLKSDLPKGLHAQIDAHYFESTKASK